MSLYERGALSHERFFPQTKLPSHICYAACRRHCLQSHDTASVRRIAGVRTVCPYPLAYSVTPGPPLPAVSGNASNSRSADMLAYGKHRFFSKSTHTMMPKRHQKKGGMLFLPSFFRHHVGGAAFVLHEQFAQVDAQNTQNEELNATQPQDAGNNGRPT